MLIQITVELKQALEAIKKLNSDDIVAIVKWLKGEGRQALHERGADDNDIGAARFDIDKFDDAPLG